MTTMRLCHRSYSGYRYGLRVKVKGIPPPSRSRMILTARLDGSCSTTWTSVVALGSGGGFHRCSGLGLSCQLLGSRNNCSRDALEHQVGVEQNCPGPHAEPHHWNRVFVFPIRHPAVGSTEVLDGARGISPRGHDPCVKPVARGAHALFLMKFSVHLDRLAQHLDDRPLHGLGKRLVVGQEGLVVPNPRKNMELKLVRRGIVLVVHDHVGTSFMEI